MNSGNVDNNNVNNSDNYVVPFLANNFNNNYRIVFEGKITFEELVEAYLSCRHHKRWTKAAIKFEVNLEDNLNKLYEDLVNGTYKISSSTTFVVSDPKYREVFAADFRDRIVHHLFINRIGPYLEEYFDDSSFNCRVGKGSLKAIYRLQEIINEEKDKYPKCCCILGLDLRAFFMSIDRKLTLHDLTRFSKINIPEDNLEFTLYLAKTILKNDPTLNCRVIGDISLWDNISSNKSLFNRSNGLPIGDLTSQHIANFILTELDIFITRHGFKLVRYVDDSRIVGKKEDLIKFIPILFRYIEDILHLSFNKSKIYLQHYTKGAPFIGYFVTRNSIIPGKRLKHKVNRLINEIENSEYTTFESINKLQMRVNSYLGFLVHCKSYTLRKKLVMAVFSKQLGFISYKGFTKITMNRKLKSQGLILS